MGFYDNHILPRVLDFAMTRSALAEQREWIMKRVRGEVLEMGFGSGVNLSYYPPQVKTLTAIEPNAAMRDRAVKRIEKSGRTVTLIARGIDKKQLLAEASFETIVSTWSLCTIADPAAAMKEVYRLLRPGGRFLFVEHGLSPDPDVATWQHRLSGVTQKWGGGCHLDRDIGKIVLASNLEIEPLEKFQLTSGLRVGSYTYRGVGIKVQ
jgi:ubiquinone/menaquinone biosynthesis C-methylase UbiE